tara:strand:- start:56163 stop:56453 length:291 start_codon:yes stop_codon:yes gene_type:complete
MNNIEDLTLTRLDRELAAARQENESLTAALAAAEHRAEELEAQYAQTQIARLRAEMSRDDLMGRCKALRTRLAKLQARLPPEPKRIAEILTFPRRA